MDARKSPRHTTFQTGWVLDPDGKEVTRCFVRDISDTGARLELRQDVELPKDFMLAFPDQKAPRACKTMWQLSIVAGITFSGS